MKIMRLGEIATYINGYAFKPQDWSESGVPIIRIQNLTGNTSSINYFNGDIPEKYKVKKGDILISWSASIGVYEWNKEESWLNQHIFKVIFDKIKINKFYFMYAVSNALKKIDKLVHGSTMKHLTKGTFDSIEIPIPSLEEQEKIVTILKSVDNIILKRNQQIFEFEQLVKSQFVEMFGDPMINPKGWQEIKISEVVDGKVSNGFFAKRNEYVDDGNVAVLGVSNVVNRMYSQCQNLPKANGTDRDIEKYGLKYGDMLFCRSSLVVEGIGKASIVPQNVPEHTLFECHVIRLPLDLSKCVPEFIQVLTTTNYFRTQIISQAKTSTMTTIGQDGILKSNIILPPLDIQNTFLTFVQQVDKSKLAVQKSLEELETLKQALMQQYFSRKEV